MDDKSIMEAYTEAGIDYAKGVERFMGNTTLYRKFLEKFLYDGSYEEFRAGMDGGDLPTAEKAVHTLKGTAGNLSMVALFKAADAVVQAIRAKKDMAEITRLASELEEKYRLVCDTINMTAGEQEP